MPVSVKPPKTADEANIYAYSYLVTILHVPSRDNIIHSLRVLSMVFWLYCDVGVMTPMIFPLGCYVDGERIFIKNKVTNYYIILNYTSVTV